MATTYSLYLESGPKRRKTMVHVPALWGCVFVGPTTEEALEGTPEAIRAYLAFVRRHGGDVDRQADFGVTVEEHVTEGFWLGNGDPSIVFGSDKEGLAPREVATAAERFRDLRGEIIELLAPLEGRRLAYKPANGRSLGHIAHHVLGASPGYLRYVFGTRTDQNKIASRAEKGELAPVEALEAQRELILADLASMTPAQRRTTRLGGKEVWTSRKSLRRLLEHEWEHHQEITRRLAV
ncbi:MAG: type II toxin-antitoxin system HicB family antitoxin [Actinomycetota bacterium]